MKKQISIICIIGMLLAVGLSGCFEETKNISQIVKSRTIYVDVNGGKDYTKIQDAIDTSSDGDIIFVYIGIYKEHLIINKSIILIGEDRDNTIITCNENFRDYSVVIVMADGVTIENFTITNSSSRMIDIGLGDVPGWITTAGVQILSNNCILRNNRFQNNDEYGIWLQNSNNNTIINNIISNNTGGIYLKNSTLNLISGNRIFSGNDGIILAYYSDGNIIQDNIISDCKYGAGIFFHSNSNNNTIEGNTIMNCLYWGIHFQSDIPHWLYLSENNIIYHNNFINNTYGVRDDYHNIWYNSTLKEGNYWDDYNGTDANGDGIGDTPYNIHGEEGDNQDLYPLMSPIGVTVTTDKSEYEQNETINITMFNGLNVGIFSLAASWSPVFSIEQIEKKTSDGWQSFFATPQWPECDIDYDWPAEIKSGESVSFDWKPLIWISGCDNFIQAEPGVYRLVIYYQIREGNLSENWTWLTAYSNEFVII